MNVAVVGTGYVGLVTGAVFADLGNDDICIDKDVDKIEGLRAGRMPIYEPGLEELVARNVADGRLTFSTDLADGVRRSDIVFIAVGTPPKATGESDLTAVEEVALPVDSSRLHAQPSYAGAMSYGLQVDGKRLTFSTGSARTGLRIDGQNFAPGAPQRPLPPGKGGKPRHGVTSTFVHNGVHVTQVIEVVPPPG